VPKSYKYGSPVNKEKIPKAKRRLPQYDECLREFVASGHEIWKVNINALPTKDVKVILSSLNWRIKHNAEFRNIQVFSRKNQVYLVRQRIFAPMDYMGGHTDYKKRAVGYILLNPDGLAYKTSEGSLNKMDIPIPIESFKGIEIRTGKEISLLRWFLIGAWSILFKKKTEYLVVTYEEQSGMLQHMVFDFHNQRKMVDELISSVSYLKRKKASNT